MNTYIGNIWHLHPTQFVVIPTNLGWNSRVQNVMGAGLALEAKKMFPDVPDWYGGHCFSMKDKPKVLVHEEHKLIMFPTKPLDKVNPPLSWKQDSSLELVEKSLHQLNKLKKIHLSSCQVAIPLVGCGNGNLPEDTVRELMFSILDQEGFTLVTLY